MEVTALLVSAFMWVCANSHFECKESTMNNLPTVELLEYGEMYELMTGEVWDGKRVDYLAGYKAGSNKIIVNKDWQKTVPGLGLDEVLLHEVVHVLQDREGPVPRCVVNAEIEAYDLQVKWQREMGRPEWLNGLWLMMLKEEAC